MKKVITIPKELVKKGDLVLIPRQEYEELLKLKKQKEQEEKDAGEIVKAFKKEEKRKLTEISRIPLLSAEEERKLSKRIEKGDIDARNKLVYHNLRLVGWVVRRYLYRAKNSELSFSDLFQEGVMGLIKAAEKYNWRKNCKFSTYAIWWIRQAITRALAKEQLRIMRIPVHMAETIAKYSQVRARLQQELGREPLPEEIAVVMNLPIEKIRQVQQISQETLSLELLIDQEEHLAGQGLFDSQVDQDRNTGSDELVIDEKTLPPDKLVGLNLLREQLENILSDLSERKQKILRMRFGLDDGVFHTLEEVARAFGVTRDRIRQIEAKVLEKIREHKKVKELLEY